MSETEKGTLVSKATHVAGIILVSVAMLLFFVAIIGAAALINGLVIKVMWGWFLVPLGLPVIGYANAIGLGFLVRYLTWQQSTATPSKDEDNKEVQVRRLMIAFIYPFIVLGVGFIAHLFM
jgi:hypothetical protein